MPTPIAPQNSLHSFDPRMRKLLEAGVTTRLIILGDKTKPRAKELKRLKHMQNRLQVLRHNLQTIDPDAAKHLYRALVVVDEENLRLIIQPRDSELNDLLSQFEAAPDVQELTINATAAQELDDLAANLED